MNIQSLPHRFSVCKLSPKTLFSIEKTEYAFLSRTADELSLVCKTEDVPTEAILREDGWRAFRVAGTLDFSLVGVLSEISAILAREGIAVFVMSTYDTDYVLVKEHAFEKACAAFAAAGHTLL